MSDLPKTTSIINILQLDISEEGKVIISGQVRGTRSSANDLTAIQYTTPPGDGIWGYTIKWHPSPNFMDGSLYWYPFSIEAPWTGDINANGVRINVIDGSTGELNLVVTLLKAKKVEEFTSEQSNVIDVEGALYDQETGQIIINVNYNGGDKNHSFALEWDGLKIEGAPPQYNLNLVDLSEIDQSDKLIHQQLRFDINTPDVQISRPAIINIKSANQPTGLKVELE